MSIASALFTHSQSRVFFWVFGHPDRGFHLSELRRLTGLGSASLQRELNRLAGAGLVTTERAGNLRLFQANRKSPVFDELVAVVRKTLGIRPMLQDALGPLLPRLHAAWIYGSVAKGTDTASSDIDLMLVGQDLRLGEVLEQLIPMEAALGRRINPTCFSPEEYAARRLEPDSFVNRVLSQPVLPLIGGANEPGGVR